jgi:ActR/RegA family two-component response regulator/two-component sensor histidine kinase
VAPALDPNSSRTSMASEVLTDAIAHEAAQPMQALSSMLREIQVVATQGKKGAFVRIRELAGDGTKLLNEVRQLQDEMRSASNLLRGERMRATYLKEEFASLEESLCALAQVGHVALSIRTQDYWLRIDNTALRRVIKLLVANAVKHSGASSITVRAFASANGLLVAVRDDGDGIDAAAIDRLFVPPNDLALADEWQARRGYGLYIVRLILARMGGRLLVRSSEIGTAFFVSLERQVLLNDGDAQRDAAVDGSMRGHLIVMLDDDARALGASSRLFETLGARVLAFTEELDLLAACQKLPRPPSLFILDYRLGDGTCRRVLESLRRWRKQEFNCVVLTGDDAVAAAASDLQSDVFVATKPLNDWALAHIQRFLRGETARITDGPTTVRE